MEEGFYYVDAAGKRQGPFGINQLRGLISPNTLVWTKGMTGWVSAGQIPALAQIFPVPTPAPSAVSSAVPQKKGANAGLIVALVLAVVVALAAVGYIVYSNHKKQQEPIQDTYTESTEQPVQEDKGYTGQHHLLGNISQYPIAMDIYVDADGNISGQYTYTKHGYSMDIDGTYSSDGHIFIQEREPRQGLVTGVFEGDREGDLVRGTFTRYKDGKQMQFILNE